MSSSPSSKAPGSLPSITALRKELDYGDAKSERCKAFYDDIRVFRKKFRTSSGKAGYKLYDWKSSEHQAWLTEMTKAYLERDGNGSLFWPDSPSAPFYNKWQYTKHATRIKSLVKQLLFRLNQQQFRNERYKGKGGLKAEQPKAAPPDNSGRSTDDPIDLDASPTSPALSRPWSSDDEAISAAARRRRPPGPAQQRRERPSYDAYAVPQDPEPGHPRTPTTKHNRSPPSDSEPEDRRAKRPRSDEVPLDTPRRTPRQKKTWQDSSFIRGDEYLETLGAAVDSRESSEEEEEPSSPRVSRFKATSSKPPTTPAAAEIVVNPDLLDPPRPRKQEALSRSATPPVDKVAEPIQPSPPPPPQREDTVSSKVPFATMGGAAAVDPAREDRQSAESTDQAKPPASGAAVRSRPAISFIYCVVLSRFPVYSYKKWEPSRKLEEMTFQQFMDELPVDGDVEGLDFTVEGPGLRAEQTIPRGDETGFDFLRRRLKKVIRGQLQMGQGVAAPLVFELEIEPMFGNNSGRKQEVDDEDFTI